MYCDAFGQNNLISTQLHKCVCVCVCVCSVDVCVYGVFVA